MASYCDQKYLLKQNHIDLDDQLVRDRSSTMPSSSTKENIPVVKRRTIFDPIYDVFSPEENTSDYLEDYIEKLGEYHVHRDTRHLHLHTPLQFGANSEKNLAFLSSMSVASVISMLLSDTITTSVLFCSIVTTNLT